MKQRRANQEDLQKILKKEFMNFSYLDRFELNQKGLPKVSVIVPTFNRCQNPLKQNTNPLEWCLESLQSQKGNVLDEIIIVNDASTDNTKEVVTSFQQKTDMPIVYIENEKNLGSSISRNRGVKRSKNNHIMFLDDDCVFSKWMIFGAAFTLDKLGDSTAAVQMPVYHRKTVPRPIDSKEIGVLDIKKGIITSNYEGFPIDYIKNLESNFIDEDLKILKPIKIKNLGGVFLTKKNVFEKIGGFPDFFTWRNGYREETDIALRFTRKRYKLFFTPDPKFYCVHLKYGSSGKQDFKTIDLELKSFIQESNITRIGTGNRVDSKEWFYSFITGTYTTLGRQSRKAADKFKYEIHKNFVVGNSFGAVDTDEKIYDYNIREAIFNQAIEDGNKWMGKIK